MPAPQAVPSSVPGGVGLYYVPPGNQPPNIVASFWHNYLATRSPYAQAAFKSTLSAQSPKEQYAALAAIAKARQAMMAEEGKNSRAELNSETQLAGQGHADYRSQLAYRSAIQSAGIRGSATMGAAKYGYDAARIKAGTIDPSTGGRVVSDFRTRSEAAQRQLSDALEAGDEAGAREAGLAYQQAVSAARDATSQMNDPLQEDAVAREIQGMPMLISDPDVQDALHKTISGSFGVSREPPIEDLGGVGGDANPPPPPRGLDPQSSTTTTKRSESIATRMREPTSAGPPGMPSAPPPSPTTSGGERQRAEGQPSGTSTSSSSASSSSAPRSRDPGVAARSTAGDPFADLEERVTASSADRANPADFNFYGRGFGVFGDGREREARRRPGGGPASRAERIANDLAEPAPAPKKAAADLYPAAPKAAPGPVNQPGTFRPSLGGLAPKGAPGPAKPIPAPAAPTKRPRSSSKSTTVKPAAAASSTPSPPPSKVGLPRAGGGAGDVKVAEAKGEPPRPGGGAGDVKLKESREPAPQGNTLYRVRGGGENDRSYEALPDGTYVLHERDGTSRRVTDKVELQGVRGAVENTLVPQAKDSAGRDYVQPKPSGVRDMLDAAYDATKPVRDEFPNATSFAEGVASRMVGALAASGSPVDELLKRRAAAKIPIQR